MCVEGVNYAYYLDLRISSSDIQILVVPSEQVAQRGYLDIGVLVYCTADAFKTKKTNANISCMQHEQYANFVTFYAHARRVPRI